MKPEAKKPEENFANKSEEISIESRFGTISVKAENSVHFPHGLLGLPDDLHFCLTDIPKNNMSQFKLLQCLNDHSLSFVVLPLGLDNPLIEKEDLQECGDILNIKMDNMQVLLIVSVQRSPESVKVTANVRAPIIIDVKDKAAIQYVFPNNKYNICQQLNE